MGTTKQNMKPTTQDGKNLFDGIKNLVKTKKTNPKDTARTYVDVLQDLEKRNQELIIAKTQDVKNESDRYGYNRKILTELQIQETLIQQIIESAARAADIMDDEDTH